MSIINKKNIISDFVKSRGLGPSGITRYYNALAPYIKENITKSNIPNNKFAAQYFKYFGVKVPLKRLKAFPVDSYVNQATGEKSKNSIIFRKDYIRFKSKGVVTYVAIIKGVITEDKIEEAAYRLPSRAPAGYKITYGFGIPARGGSFRVGYMNLHEPDRSRLYELYEKTFLVRYGSIGVLCVTATVVKRRVD